MLPLVAVLAVLLGLTAVVEPAVAKPAPSLSKLRTELRAGRFGRTHGSASVCTATVHGRPLDLLCTARVVTAAKGSTLPMVTAGPTGYGPADLARAFDLPANTIGSTNTVAIVGIGAYPNLESDLATYRSRFGLPPCTTANGCLKVVNYHGGPPLKPKPSLADVEEDYAVETALDVQMASAGCPTCKIDMVQIPMNLSKLAAATTGGLPAPLARDFGTAVKEAVKLGASAVSMSYGLPNGGQARALQQGAPATALHHPGVAILASSGDSGYTAQQTYPAEVRWVTSVGGVSLTTTNGGATYSTSAWGSMFTPSGSTSPEWVGAGSGCVTSQPAAVGQSTAAAADCNDHRAVADVSADADPLTGVAVYDSYRPYSGGPGGYLVVGGTSASSPWLGGLYARAGTSGVDGPNTMYSAPAGAITDVVGGSNSQDGTCSPYAAAVCNGVPGWDGPTGVGVPNGLGAF
jgi:subtilase family serine protease